MLHNRLGHRFFIAFVSEDDKQKISQTVSRIRNNAKWYKDAVNKANTRHISVDEMIIIDAMALFNKEKSEDER